MVCLFLPTPYAQAGRDTRSVFKQMFKFRVFLLLE